MIRSKVRSSSKETRKPSRTVREERRAPRVEKRGRKTSKASKKTRRPREVEQVDAVREKFTKTGLFEHLADVIGEENIGKKEVAKVIGALADTIKGALGPRGIGEFQIPGIVAFKLKQKKAVKGGEIKVSPFTGEKYKTKPKPASTLAKAYVRSDLKKYVALRGGK